MGNALVSHAPSEVHSVEEYIAAVPYLQAESKLGSTRFLKTVKVRAKGCDNPLVAKVFVIHDNSLPLAEHQQNISRIKNALENCPNALPFADTIIAEKFAVLLRQYVKYSLYDRISTRPFLSMSEKRWIAFQLLCGLAQCHRAEVCHGDIKLNNILVTGWNWVVLTDFASFKPTMLPESHPGEFAFYFDTSVGENCYLAPERFYKERQIDKDRNVLDDSRGNLTPAMDIFSLGCVFIEMFSETGKRPFKLQDIIAYINHETFPPALQEIKDEGIRALCTDMIRRNPSQRKTADEYLIDARKQGIFPECFYNGLLDYLKTFALDTSHPDSQITRLYKDHTEPFFQKIAECEDGVLALTNFITSMLRSLKHSSAKLVALKLMKFCSGKVAAPIILDRLLPFILNMLSDPCPLVVSEAVYVLSDSLENVQNVPEPDAFVFVEYIIPELQKVSTDHNTVVRVALAGNIGSLAQSALRFLETSHLSSVAANREETSNMSFCRTSYEHELEELHLAIQNIVATLISDSCNHVKRMLLEKGANSLCVFFGQERAHDVLLSHMVTFLNDSSDHELRSSFFDSVAGVASFVGTAVNQILMPLIEQGFKDSHDTVVCSALKCVTGLTEIRFFRPTAICELFKSALDLLAHRNSWIKAEAAVFLSCAAMNVPIALRECRLRGYLRPYMECPVVQIEKPEVIVGLATMHPHDRHFHKSTNQNDLEIIVDEKKSKQINLKSQHYEDLNSHDILCEALLQQKQLERLFQKKRELADELHDVETNDGHFSQAWKPKGTLIAHMHEHSGAINKIVSMPEGRFATCSQDGTVKLWDWNRVEKRTMTNKSIYTYSRLTGDLIAMDFCPKEKFMVVASNSGNMEVFTVDDKEPRRVSDKLVDPIEDQYTVDVKLVGGPVMAYATNNGGIHGWDLRSPSPAFKLKNDISVGQTQCMAVHASKSWLAVGTIEGSVVCWDLRFQIPITQVNHPYKSRVYKLVIPKNSSNGDVWASHLGNSEVNLWKLENQTQVKTLWASNSSPFTDRGHASKHVAYAICQSSSQYLFTAGTDLRIRCWDISGQAENSCLIARSALDSERMVAVYKPRTLDGIEVIHETLRKPATGDGRGERMGNRAAVGHSVDIKDMAIIKTQRQFLVSGSKDGVVKIWK